MRAPTIQRNGKKIPSQNIHPCPFLSVIMPSVNTKNRYKMAPPKPLPHHMVPPLTGRGLEVRLECHGRNETAHHPRGVSGARRTRASALLEERTGPPSRFGEPACTTSQDATSRSPPALGHH